MKHNKKTLSLAIATLLLCILSIFIGYRIAIFITRNSLLAIQTTGNGEIIKKTIFPGEFANLKVTGWVNVKIKLGKTNKVILKTDKNVMPFLHARIVNNTLNIGIDPKVAINPSQAIQANITAKHLKKASLNGKITLDANNIQSKQLTLNLSGKSNGYLAGKINNLTVNLSGISNIKICKINGKTIRMYASGKSIVELCGKVNNFTTSTSGPAKIMAKNLTADSVFITGAGNNTITVRALKSLHINTFGTSVVKYYGNPTDISKRGPGKIILNKMSSLSSQG